MITESSSKKIPAGDDVVRLLRPASEPTQSKKPSPTLPQSSSKRRTFIVVALIVCAVAVYGATQWLLGPKLQAFVVARDNVLETIVASGRVETPLRIDIGTQVTSTVAAIPVLEGQSVVSG
jgi:multidrug efflux pump subunit AcrA (membrane-fusion protein)